MSERYQGTHISAPATFRGVSGEAWRLELPPLGARGRPDLDGTVACYIVRVPGAHAFWDHWNMSVVHLRPIPGVKAATRHRPDVTHELIIGSLDPEEPLPAALVADGTFRLHILRPLDVVEQFTVRDDAIADRLLELAVRAVVDGFASPDQDWRIWWGQAIHSTAAHFADGTHRVDLQ